MNSMIALRNCEIVVLPEFEAPVRMPNITAIAQQKTTANRSCCFFRRKCAIDISPITWRMMQLKYGNNLNARH